METIVEDAEPVRKRVKNRNAENAKFRRYYAENKEKEAERQRRYKRANREHTNRTHREWMQRNRESGKFACNLCGTNPGCSSLLRRHEQTAKHKKQVELQNATKKRIEELKQETQTD